MRMRVSGVLAIVGMAGAPWLPAQERDWSKVEVVPQKVTEGIYMITGAGGNLGVAVGPDGVFLIDDQYAPLTHKIKAAIATVSDKPVRFVLNTHWHGDHTGGNENLGLAGALIVAHDNVRVRMSVEQFIEAFGQKVPAAPKVALPVVTFNDAVTFHLNDQEIHAFHVAPAHTDGDAVIHFRKADVIHAGDVFFNGLYPFIDVGSGGGLEGTIAAAERILALCGEKTKLIPGHGPLAGKADLVAYRDMLVGIRNQVKPLVAAGKTLAEVQAAKPTAAFDEKWGKGFLKPEQFAAIAYASLKKK